jgi:hypothetical protein
MAKIVSIRLGERLKGTRCDLDESEWAFHLVPSCEHEVCLAHEINRERAFCQRESILNRRRAIEAEIPDASKSRQALQGKLNACNQNTRPWIRLTDDEKSVAKADYIPDVISYFLPEPSEPVNLLAGLDERGRNFLNSSQTAEVLELAVDWSKTDTRLKKSFGKLIKRLRGIRACPKSGSSVMTCDHRGYE